MWPTHLPNLKCFLFPRVQTVLGTRPDLLDSVCLKKSPCRRLQHARLPPPPPPPQEREREEMEWRERVKREREREIVSEREERQWREKGERARERREGVKREKEGGEGRERGGRARVWRERGRHKANDPEMTNQRQTNIRMIDTKSNRPQ